MASPFPADLSLVPVSRHPLRLAESTVQTIENAPLPAAEALASRPRFSIVMVTFNQLVFTKLCLATVLANTPTRPDYEVIIVDNASSDGTVEYLECAASQQPRIHVVLNASNRGFAAAVNQGLDQARGAVLVILNNDTLVPPGWLQGLARHLADPCTGLVGPVTNSAANEAQIDATYETYGGFVDLADERTRTRARLHSRIHMLTMFCLAMRRDTYERLGPLDERFIVGTFEDDDYSRRAQHAGLDVVCAEDVFIHHFGQASFGALVPGGAYAKLLADNRGRFEEKWGVVWEPHRRRPNAAYATLVEGIRSVVDALLPDDATVLVISKGDDVLLNLGARRSATHFPQLTGGTYAGYYPQDSAAAVAHLEQLRAAGADYLLFPSTSLWWLDHYTGLRQHLDKHYQLLLAEQDTCWIYQLGGRPVA